MDTQVEKCIETVEEFEGIWCNETDTPVDKCTEKVEEFEGIWCNQFVTQTRSIYSKS